MSTASRRAEFFALEAREYLADLGATATADAPDLERLVRGARALRGAALMAGLGTYARSSAGLEALARQVRDHAIPWLPAARAAWLDGLQTLKELTERAPGWEAVDDRAALALADRIERVTVGGPKVSAPVTPALTPGVRAFIARESATIAGTLAEASRALAPVPPQAALAAVLERMRALRGLGGAAELSPLPELLDAMEMATRTLLSDVPPPPNVAALFAEAAHVLGTMARSMAEDGRVEQPRELAGLAESLLTSYTGELDVLPIAALAPSGMDSLIRPGVPPHLAGDASPVPLELVGVGDHLLETATALQRSPSSAASDLRLFVLHRTLVTMPPRSPTGRFLAPLAHAIAAAIAAGVARSDGERFLALLREAGRFLTRAGNDPADHGLLHARDQLAATILRSAGHPVRDISPTATPTLLASPRQSPPQRPRVPARDEPIVAIESLAPDDEPVVTIESLAPDDEPIVAIESLAPDDEPIVTIESLAPAPTGAAERLVPADAAGSAGRLERAFRRRSELERSRGDEAPSLERLIGAGIVPIGQLCYRGAAALARAAQVREEINGLLAEPTVSLDRLRPYIQELLDLVPLARDAA